MEITKQRLKFADKMQNVELYLKEATVVWSCLRLPPLAAKLPNVKVGKTRLLPLVQLRAQ